MQDLDSVLEGKEGSSLEREKLLLRSVTFNSCPSVHQYSSEQSPLQRSNNHRNSHWNANHKHRTKHTPLCWRLEILKDLPTKFHCYFMNLLHLLLCWRIALNHLGQFRPYPLDPSGDDLPLLVVPFPRCVRLSQRTDAPGARHGQATVDGSWVLEESSVLGIPQPKHGIRHSVEKLGVFLPPVLVDGVAQLAEFVTSERRLSHPIRARHNDQ
mmetsp:Transcript_57442/g.171362  ORF Transcript_57442/g.171362 Transcript_57442/m.171362 type:complete len:212 (-) Transcript_57442:415-1050(-)